MEYDHLRWSELLQDYYVIPQRSTSARRRNVSKQRATGLWRFFCAGEAFRLRASQPQSAVGLVQAACFDSTDLRSLSSRDLDDSKRGRGEPDVRVVILEICPRLYVCYEDSGPPLGRYGGCKDECGPSTYV